MRVYLLKDYAAHADPSSYSIYFNEVLRNFFGPWHRCRCSLTTQWVCLQAFERAEDAHSLQIVEDATRFL